jgi:hypothetical protein
MWRRVANTALRIGGRPVLNAAVGLIRPSVERIGQDIFHEVYTVTLPVTVYVYGVNSQVTVRYQPGTEVTVHAALRAAFGIRLTVEQDIAGLYIIAKRLPVAGAITRADFTLIVPPETRLLAQLTPGTLLFEDFDGTIEALPVRKSDRK